MVAEISDIKSPLAKPSNNPFIYRNNEGLLTFYLDSKGQSMQGFSWAVAVIHLFYGNEMQAFTELS